MESMHYDFFHSTVGYASTISAKILATGGSKEIDTLAEVQYYRQTLSKNTNALCVSICKDNGYVIAAIYAWGGLPWNVSALMVKYL